MRYIKSFRLFESKQRGTETTPEVAAAAKAKGYTIGPVYHGTNSDFNEFDPDKSAFRFLDDQMKFFFAFDKKNAVPPVGEPKRILAVYLMGTKQGHYGEDERGEDTLVPKDADYVKLGNLHVSVKYPEQIKLADPVTYDDDGNPIPLEKRFDRTKKDIRY